MAQKKLLSFCNDKGISLTAYSPLGNPGSPYDPNPTKANLLKEPLVNELAAKYKKSEGQILIRFQVQRGIVVIPKSVTKSRIESNIQVFDFELTDDEIAALEKLDRGYRSCPGDPGFEDNINYPFHIPF